MGFETLHNLVRSFFQTNVQKVTFLKEPVELLAKDTISFTNSDGTIKDSADALGIFDGFKQVVSSGAGESGNNGIFQINKAVEAGEMTVTDTLTDEAAGASVSLKVPIPVIWDNDGLNVPINDTEYIEFNIDTAPTRLVTKGNLDTYRTVFVANALIFTPLHFMDTLGLQIADTIWNAHVKKSTGGVRFNTPSKPPSSSIKDGAYYITPMNLPGQYDEQI